VERGGSLMLEVLPAEQERRARAMFHLAVLLLIWTFICLFPAWVVAVLDGSKVAIAQAVLALGGVVLALGAFLTSKLRRGRPGLWLLATGVASVAWLLLMLLLVYG
jgi:nitrate reductase gamma subunit